MFIAAACKSAVLPQQLGCAGDLFDPTLQVQIMQDWSETFTFIGLAEQGSQHRSRLKAHAIGFGQS